MQDDYKFEPIPDHPGYEMNRMGQIKIVSSGKIAKLTRASNGRMVLSIVDNKGVRRAKGVLSLAAMTFYPDEYSKRIPNKTMVVPRDFDHSNLKASNVAIMSQNEWQLLLSAKKREEMLEQLQWSSSKELAESPKKGFYWIPFIRHPIAVSREGLIWDFRLDDYASTTLNERGYVVLSMSNPDTQKSRTFFVHRIVARVFIEIPERYRHLDLPKIHINHLDGDKQNNSVDNLEWCLNQENIHHAIENGLRDMVKPVLVKNIHTGEIKRFLTVQAARDHLSVASWGLRQHLKSKRDAGRVVINGSKVVKYDDGTPWPELTMSAGNGTKVFLTCAVLVTDTESGHRMLFSSMADASRGLKLPHRTMMYNRKKTTDGYTYLNYLFQDIPNDPSEMEIP